MVRCPWAVAAGTQGAEKDSKDLRMETALANAPVTERLRGIMTLRGCARENREVRRHRRMLSTPRYGKHCGGAVGGSVRVRVPAPPAQVTVACCLFSRSGLEHRDHCCKGPRDGEVAWIA